MSFTKSQSPERLDAVRSLAEYSRSLTEISDHLNTFKWDYEGQLFCFSKGHIVSVLERYLSGEFTSKNIEEWANIVECREDIYFDKDYEEKIENVIYELANPILTRFLDPFRARDIISVFETG